MDQPMSNAASLITTHLKSVEVERLRRRNEAELVDKVATVKAFQQKRFALTYADLIDSQRYGLASRFFLKELYGPADFSERDAQFSRVVPALVRLFPREIVETVATLVELHALSEQLDTSVATKLAVPRLDGLSYARAWQGATGAAEREQQISLTLEVIDRLDGLTRKPLLRSTLRMMRPAARAAGLVELQNFLESGFDAFAAMKGTEAFKYLIATRERSLANSLFETNLDTGEVRSLRALLDQLP
jgi:hypothetical protein